MEAMQLKEGALLQGGKYRIESVLGQGGFGITYLAVQTDLNRKVAIKEFFMKIHCNRDEGTSHVSVPSVGSRAIVDKFKAKFIKEAQTIAAMENEHIIKIHETFEENGTAYYVMEYINGGSLSDCIPSGGFPEDIALKYIHQIARTLQYVHEEKHILHLDVKPSNILLRKSDMVVLIDFGISKHYDTAGDAQTSTTPVGVSVGYAPKEQYKLGGVSQFSPATDIYSLGATLYKLLTGQTPPDALDVDERGLSDLPEHISASVRAAVVKATKPQREDRPQSVAEFLALLDATAEEERNEEDESEEDEIVVQDDQDETDVVVSEHDETEEQSSGSISSPAPRKRRLWLWLTLIAAAVIGSILFFMRPSEYDATGYDNGHGYVDLGLPSGLKWATCNVGASNPEDYGDYYAWGDLKPMTDQCHGTPCREEINISGNPKYDVARAKWGGNWRMPTKENFDELKNQCTWEWTTKGGHKGYKVTGPNGNSIFLPAAGYRYGADTFNAESYGNYWSATPYESDSQDACYLYFDSGDRLTYLLSLRLCGRSVRPVSE